MKTIIFILTLSALTVTTKTNRDCSSVYSSAYDAYNYCKKAYVSESWDDTKSSLKKAMISFEDAMSYAENDDCKCEDAHTVADEGYTYTKKGYNSSDWEETKDYARKAKSSADDAMSYANDCND